MVMLAQHNARPVNLQYRHCAKRQFTWFRHQLAAWPCVAPQDALEELMRACIRSARRVG
jgi:tRNA A37 N6-isopentenylltransferase MiaA